MPSTVEPVTAAAPTARPPKNTLWHPDRPFAPAKFPFFYGWVVLVVGSIGVFASIPGQTLGVSVFTDFLIADLGIARTPLSFAYLIGTLASAFLLPSAGRLLDRMGARKLATISALGLGASLLYLAASPVITAAIPLPITIFGTALVPFTVITVGFFWIRFWGQGTITMVSRAMVGKWFNKRRGIAMGIMGVAMGIVMSASPRLLDGMIQLFGWQGAYLVLGIALIFGMGSIACLFFRDNPEECGLVMDGGDVAGSGKPDHLDLIIKRDYSRQEALHTYAFWVFALVFSWQAMFVTAYSFHIVAIGAEYGFEREEIISLFLYAAPFSVLTDLSMGWVSSRTRVKYILILECACISLVGLGVLAAQTAVGDLVLLENFPWGIPSFTIAHLMIVVGLGVGGGCFGILTGIVWPRYFGRTHLGAISGLATSGIVIGSAAGPIAFSSLRDLTGTFAVPIIISTLVPILLALAATRADNPQRTI